MIGRNENTYGKERATRNSEEETNEELPMIKITANSEESETKAEKSEKEERDTWANKVEYLLSMLGYCVGLGNIWRFPYICLRNGGGAFLIPFLFFLVSCGLPLYFLEVTISQFNGKGVLSIWNVCPLFRGIGVGMLILGVVISFYYNIMPAWVLYYFVSSFKNPLPWSTCNNVWNTENCILDINKSGDRNNSIVFSNRSILTTTYDFNHTEETKNTTLDSRIATSGAEFWRNEILQLSSGIEDIGYFPWHLIVTFLVAWIITCLTVIKGVKSIGKVVYITATLPYIILIVLFIRGVTLPGGVDGIMYYLQPNFNRLLDSQVWLEAAVQVFYSLGPCWGGIITMASYNKFHNNCMRDAIVLTFCAEGTSIFGGLAVFSVLGYMAKRLRKPIDELVDAGPGLGFVVYPEAVSLLPFPNLWACLFFLMLLTVVLDTIFVNFEILTSAIFDTFTKLRRRRIVVTCLLSLLLFLAGLPLCTQAGIYIFQLIDWYIGTLSVMIFGTIECMIFGWIYGIRKLSRDLKIMIGRQVPVILQFCICFFTPVVLMVTFVLTLISYKPPNYGSYNYPAYCQVIGWIIAALPILPLPVYMVIEIRKTKENSLIQKILKCLQPTPCWRPNNKKLQDEYRKVFIET